MSPEARKRWEDRLADDYFIFLDESGNHHWGEKGTRYLVYTAISGSDIRPGIEELHALKHWTNACGIPLEYFHAAEDRQIVRDHVFQIIRELPIRIDSIIVDKPKTNPPLRPLQRLYPRMFDTLLTYLLLGYRDYHLVLLCHKSIQALA